MATMNDAAPDPPAGPSLTLVARRFPILGAKAIVSIPWPMIAACQRRALANHAQTLERLAERGGLSPQEALWVLDDQEWTVYHPDHKARVRAEAEAELIRRVNAWEAEHAG
jgi:hypothetical protein